VINFLGRENFSRGYMAGNQGVLFKREKSDLMIGSQKAEEFASALMSLK